MNRWNLLLFSVVFISPLSAQEKIDVDSIHEGSEKVGNMFLKATLNYTGVLLVLHACPSDKVKIEPLEDIYSDTISVVRLEVSNRIESREEIVKNLEKLMANNQPIIIHTFVALCDNVHQGIIPVSEILGNGDDPVHNLYWGARYGVKTFFKNSQDWDLIANFTDISSNILERCIFKRKK